MCDGIHDRLRCDVVKAGRSRRDGGMAQLLADHADIQSFLAELRRMRVPQAVGVNPACRRRPG